MSAYFVKHCKNKFRFLCLIPKHCLQFIGYIAQILTVMALHYFSATRYWLHNLHLNITHPWHPWMDSRGQVNYLFFECLGSQQTFPS